MGRVLPSTTTRSFTLDATIAMSSSMKRTCAFEAFHNCFTSRAEALFE
jgi:hypothetical protein